MRCGNYSRSVDAIHVREMEDKYVCSAPVRLICRMMLVMSIQLQSSQPLCIVCAGCVVCGASVDG